MNWNVIVTVRHDYGRAVQLLRKHGTIERTGLFNVIVMRVADVHALLEQIEQAADPRFFDTISHIVPVTHKLTFSTAEDLERQALAVALGWQAQLAGRSVHVRMRRRGHKGEIHGAEVEHQLGKMLLDELARRGTPGRFEHDDPDLVIAIETIRDEAGLALWTRAELERYPFLRASIERGASRRAPGAPRESAPSRELLASATEIAARSPTAHPASASEIVDLLGELEPLTLEKLVATGATIGEVAEAVSAIEDEDAFGEMHHAPSTPREAEVRAILEDLVFEDFEDRESEIART
jgi:tRNA(Ser,Leu) C12 N-acetylase TAN1